jgi:hypothetical protein
LGGIDYATLEIRKKNKLKNTFDRSTSVDTMEIQLPRLCDAAGNSV